MRSRTSSLFIVVVVLALIIGGIYYFETYVVGSPSSSYSQNHSVYDVLETGNTFFSLGESLSAQGNAQAAQDAYQKALTVASDDVQKGVINLKLAIIGWTTDPIGSIAPFEAIATNPAYANSTRAYALQYIAQAYDAPPIPLSLTQTQQLVSTTFAASPFSAMYADGDAALAYRQMYDAADALYPLPLPEAMSAHWYADQILASASQLGTSTVSDYTAKINADFSALDGAIQTEASDPGLNIFTAIALEYKADAMRELSIAGLEGPIDVASAYQAALSAFGTVADVGTADGFARLNYAIYLLAADGTSQATQAHSILAPIYANPAYATSPLGVFLKGMAASTSGLRRNVILVANNDPQFKSYLMTLGWTSAELNS